MPEGTSAQARMTEPACHLQPTGTLAVSAVLNAMPYACLSAGHLHGMYSWHMAGCRRSAIVELYVTTPAYCSCTCVDI
jgi:hypothetical protein